MRAEPAAVGLLRNSGGHQSVKSGSVQPIVQPTPEFATGPIIPPRLRLQSFCACVQPSQFGGLLFPAFLGQCRQPAANTVMAGLYPVGYAVALFLNRP